LKQALRNHVIDRKRQQKRKKQQPLAAALRPDAWPEGWERLDPLLQQPPDTAFHIAWVQALLDAALTRVRGICEEKGQAEHLALFLGRYLSLLPDPPSWGELGSAYGIGGEDARHRAETAARHFRLVLRELLVAETGSEAAADEELAALLANF